ncbi:MAG: 2-hydroxyacid dehydrogenase [Alphaproteobacteria bacterium]
MKVVLHNDAGAQTARRLAELASEGIEVTVTDGQDKTRFAALMAETDVLWHMFEPVTAALMASAPRLKLVQRLGVGLDSIDLAAARARGIAVANTPGANAPAVAEMALTLILAALRRLSLLDRTTRMGGWAIDPVIQRGMGEVAGRTVGLVGYGSIPSRLAPVLAAMGARVLYTARAPKADAKAEWRALPDLLAEADIVSLHVPLTPETDGMIGREALARMKPAAILVNTARGALVDEAALLAALRSGHLAAAGLDVFASEPVKADNPLLALDNVVVAPHAAWMTAETMDRCFAMALDNVRRLADGRQLTNRAA